MAYKLYVLRDPRDNQIRYIGVTSKELNVRLSGHIRDKRNNKRTSWLKSLKKQGLKPTIELVNAYDTEEEVFEAEIQSIKRHRILGYELVNSCDGGRGTLNRVMSEEQKEKLRQINIGKSTITPEGRNKISQTHRGKKRSPEVIEKVRLARIGSTWNEDSRKKFAESQKGNKIRCLMIECIETGDVFESIKQCSEQLGILRTSISNMLSGYSKTAGKLTFKYVKKV